MVLMVPLVLMAVLLLMAVLILNGCSQLMFTLTKEYSLLILSRFLTGFFQVFVSIYFPVWSDMFGATDR